MNITLPEAISTVEQAIELFVKLREVFGSDIHLTQEMIDEAIAAMPAPLKKIEEPL